METFSDFHFSTGPADNVFGEYKQCNRRLKFGHFELWDTNSSWIRGGGLFPGKNILNRKIFYWIISYLTTKKYLLIE